MPERVAFLLRRLTLLSPLVVDTVVAVVFTLGTWLWAMIESGYAARSPDMWSFLLTAVVHLPLAARRRSPFLVLVVSCAAAIAYHALGYHPGQNNMGPLLALYTVSAHSRPGACVAAAILTVTEWTHATTRVPGLLPWSALGQSIMVCGFAVAFGISVRLLADRNRKLARLTEHLHREQADKTHQALTQERARIARELHDIVAHHMSVISVQAGLGHYVLPNDPDTADRALTTIADTCREALGEMRRLLSLIRADDPPEERYAAAPGLRLMGTLVERLREAGIPVKVTVQGSQRPIPPGLDLCAYRIVQECLTNVLKHAGRTTTQLTLTYGPTALTINSLNAGRPGQMTQPTPGHGLIGMTERVKLYQGTITFGPLPSGGFQVVATLPLPSHGSAPLSLSTGDER